MLHERLLLLREESLNVLSRTRRRTLPSLSVVLQFHVNKHPISNLRIPRILCAHVKCNWHDSHKVVSREEQGPSHVTRI